MSDIESGPEDGCEACGSKELTRTMQVSPNKNIVWKCGGSHDSTYTKYRSRK